MGLWVPGYLFCYKGRQCFNLPALEAATFLSDEFIQVNSVSHFYFLNPHLFGCTLTFFAFYLSSEAIHTQRQILPFGIIRVWSFVFSTDLLSLSNKLPQLKIL